MILEIFKNSFEYAFKDKKLLLKLGLLSISSFLILPLVLICGYSYRIIEIGLNGMMDSFDPLPKLDSYIKMFIQGLKMLVVAFIYLLIPILILANLFINTNIIQTFEFVDFSNFSIQLDVGFIFILLIAILFLFSFLMTIVAIPHMIKNNSLKYAFKVNDLLKIIRYVGTGEFILFYISVIILVIVIPLIIFIASQIIVSLINYIVILITGAHIGISILNYLNISVFAVILFFLSLPTLIIAVNRAISFMYNDDGIENQESI